MHGPACTTASRIPPSLVVRMLRLFLAGFIRMDWLAFLDRVLVHLRVLSLKLLFLASSGRAWLPVGWRLVVDVERLGHGCVLLGGTWIAEVRFPRQRPIGAARPGVTRRGAANRTNVFRIKLDATGAGRK